MAELESADFEPTSAQFLKEIYGIVSRIESRLQDIEERQKAMEARQVQIKEKVQAQLIPGSFASTDQ